jgi:SpoVK/Ycf46/Vps4 family AAA+-type ATPase
MTQPAQSEYIRYNNKTALIRRWVATILLKSNLECQLMFNRLDPVITSGFDTSSFTKENQEDAEFIRSWLESELQRCEDEVFDESDVFAVNTRRLQKSMGLNKAELAVLRFACLLNSYKPLEAATENINSLTEADVCDLLADLLRIPFGLIYSALRPSGILRQSGLVLAAGGWSGTDHLTRWLTIPDMLAREIFREQDKDNLLINVFYTTGPKSTLTQHDFPQRAELALIKDYLRASIKDKATGANVLIWGPPGTGKTEMARHVAQALRKKCIEINSMDVDGRPLKAEHRLDCYRFGQAILARGSNAIVVFDEVEDILCDGSYTRFGFKGQGTFTKGLMNNVLETNPTPAIWVTNTVDGVDPAYLRRFDLVVNLDTPVRLIKKKIAWRAFKNLPMKETMIDRMVEHRGITPAHMTKVTRICERVGVETPEHAAAVARQVLNGDLKAVHARPIDHKRDMSRRKRGKTLPYRPNLINSDVEVSRLADNLSPDSSVRICAFGPPGTGKTAWARYLAERIKRPLLVKHAADILDKYIGGTEENIAAAFREARETNSILMLDEVDSFLPDRASADRHWQITQANQFLTAMEEFDGILFCATNLKGNLDPATMRRFDFKIHFDYLGPEQATLIAVDLLEALKVKVTRSQESALCAEFRNLKLAHGDFAALLRRYEALKAKPDWRELVADLKTEASYREETSRPIGFLAELQSTEL